MKNLIVSVVLFALCSCCTVSIQSKNGGGYSTSEYYAAYLSGAKNLPLDWDFIFKYSLQYEVSNGVVVSDFVILPENGKWVALMAVHHPMGGGRLDFVFHTAEFLDIKRTVEFDDFSEFKNVIFCLDAKPSCVTFGEYIIYPRLVAATNYGSKFAPAINQVTSSFDIVLNQDFFVNLLGRMEYGRKVVDFVRLNSADCPHDLICGEWGSSAMSYRFLADGLLEFTYGKDVYEGDWKCLSGELVSVRYGASVVYFKVFRNIGGEDIMVDCRSGVLYGNLEFCNGDYLLREASDEGLKEGEVFDFHNNNLFTKTRPIDSSYIYKKAKSVSVQLAPDE